MSLLTSLLAPGNTYQPSTGVKVTRTTDLAIPNGAFTAVAFTSEQWDTDAFHDNATNNSRLTVPTGLTGRFRVTCAIYFASSATGRRIVELRKNGTTIFGRDERPASGNGTPITLTASVSLAEGDYVEAHVYQTSGASLNVTAAATDLWSSLELEMISAPL